MGAVYDVNLKLKYSSANSVIKATKYFVTVNSGKVKFSDVDYSSIESAIQIILPKRGFHINNQTNNSIDCDCSFDASYSWESVMCNWFSTISVTLNSGSSIDMYPDNGHIIGKVQSNGDVFWNEDEDEDEDEDWEDNENNENNEDTDSGMKVSDPELQEAINLINQYSEGEFGHICIDENTNLSDIGVMYSTAGDDDQVELQVIVDLNNLEMRYEVNGEVRHTDTYSSLKQLIADELEILDFDDLYSYAIDFVTDEDYEI